MNLIIFFTTINVLTFMAYGILFCMKLKIKRLEKENEKIEARRKMLAMLLMYQKILL